MKWLLPSIIVLAVFLRIYQLESVPKGFSEDEAAVGYNAYSIAKTGRDEEGKFMPIVFRSFGDYKLPIPVYLTSVSVTIFGLSVFSVRIVPVFFGVLAVGLMYILAKPILGRRSAAIIPALMLAISPWHVQLSRTETAITVAVSLFLLEMIVLVRAGDDRKKGLLLILIQLGLLLTHPAMWLLSLPFVIYWLIRVGIKKKGLGIGLAIILLIGTGITGVATRNSIKAYYFDKAFYKEVGFINRINQLQGYAPMARLVQNKAISLADQLSKNYLRSFDFYYLFSNSDTHEKFFVNAFGKFYSIEMFGFLAGIYILVKRPVKENKLLWGMVFLAPMPGLLTTVSQSGDQLFLLAVPFYLISALGFCKLASKPILILAGLILILSAGTFFRYYFGFYPSESMNDWSYGYKQVNNKAREEETKFDHIIISDALATKPYIFTLFFQKIDPRYYQGLVKNRGGSSFISTTAFGKYEFRSITANDAGLKKTLLFNYDKENLWEIKSY